MFGCGLHLGYHVANSMQNNRGWKRHVLGVDGICTSSSNGGGMSAMAWTKLAGTGASET